MQNLLGCSLLINKAFSENNIHSRKMPSEMCIACYTGNSNAKLS